MVRTLLPAVSYDDIMRITSEAGGAEGDNAPIQQVYSQFEVSAVCKAGRCGVLSVSPCLLYGGTAG